MGGKGPKGARKYWEGRRGGKRNGLQGRYCFLRFFRPPDERKNPDWSDFKNYLIRRSDWSTTCHSRSTRTQLAPTNFAAKKAAWFWLDNFDSQTFYSWVGFAYLIRGRNEENKSILAGVPDPHAPSSRASRARFFPLPSPSTPATQASNILNSTSE